jgi:hypothetical protein
MGARTRIVVWDARGPAHGGWAEGELIEEDVNTRRELLTGFAHTLPVDVEAMQVNPVGGYFRRSWGRGEPLPRDTQRFCAMLLWCSADRGFLHWAARVVPTSPDRRPTGRLRLGAAPVVAGSFTGGLAATAEAVDIGAACEVQEVPGGGWIVGGVCGVSCATDGYFSLCLLGAGADGAVLWTAVTQASRPA